VKPSRRRPVVEYLCGGYQISERRGCKGVRRARSTRRYRSRKDPQTALRMRIREIARARGRYGDRKIRVLLRREGWKVGKKRV
jgi:putative transposase